MTDLQESSQTESVSQEQGSGTVEDDRLQGMNNVIEKMHDSIVSVYLFWVLYVCRAWHELHQTQAERASAWGWAQASTKTGRHEQEA